MLTIRLHRVGKTNRPSFKIVVVDKRASASSGKFREQVGSLDRINKEIKINKEKIAYWVSKGAKLSPAVNNLLIDQKAIEGKKIAVHAQPKKQEGGEKGAQPSAQSATGQKKPAAAPAEEKPENKPANDAGEKENKEEEKKEDKKENE